MENSRKYRIFRKDVQKKDGGTFPKYSTKLGYKPQDSDEWVNEFFGVEFRIKGGVDIKHGTDIIVPPGGDAPSFKLREYNLPDVLVNVFRQLWQTDEQKTKYLLSDLGLKLENGKFFKIEPVIAIYQYEDESGGFTQQSNSAWGSAPQPKAQVPDGWGSAPAEDVVEGFSAAEDDVPF